LTAASRPINRIAELYFADQAAMDAAFGSAERAATARDYSEIAPAGSRMFIEVVED
jgi:hypothetical protein